MDTNVIIPLQLQKKEYKTLIKSLELSIKSCDFIDNDEESDITKYIKTKILEAKFKADYNEDLKQRIIVFDCI